MKKYILVTTFVVVIAGVLFALNVGTKQSELPTATSTPAVQTGTLTGIVVPNENTARQREQTVVSDPTSTPTNARAALPAPNVTLSVAGESYTAFAPQGSTVLDAMKILASTSAFVFSGKDYPSLGFFVDSINGKKAESGYNWILYVNGTLSGTGASQTTLKAGDAIEWRYERNY